MQSRSKKLHSAKNKRRTVSKRGGFWSFSSASSPTENSPSNADITTIPANKSSTPSWMSWSSSTPSWLIWSSSTPSTPSPEKANTEFKKGEDTAEKSTALNVGQEVVAAASVTGGKKRSRKSRKSKKRILKK
jgi:hypothetical protein